MIKLAALSDYLRNTLEFDSTLAVTQIDPYMCNGLAFSGRNVINRVGFGVSASISLFEKAKKNNCDALIVHHSFNYPTNNRYNYLFENRYKYLVKEDISLFGYHFLLDAHPQLGNNASIIVSIGAQVADSYKKWGYFGEFRKPVGFEEIMLRLNDMLNSKPIVYKYGSDMIKKVAVISGKGAPHASDMQDLLDNQVNLYITGEAHEWNKEMFKETKINFIAGGHYATEVFGLKALMGKMAKDKLGVELAWLDVYNEI